jgi:uncharacterized membrane protein YfcA
MNMSIELTTIFYILLFLVAFLYASVGHGGASGYLALMALFSFSPEVMKPTALVLNLFVSLTAFIQYYRGGHFQWKVFLPLAIASVPMSFLGGMMTVDAVLYKKLLGLLLLVPVIRFLFFRNIPVEQLRPSKPLPSLAIGGGIGFLSGMIGIGGGILLSPVLLLLKWTDQKQTAAISALFIFVNSMAGLAGQMTKGVPFHLDMAGYVAVAFTGGLAGAWLGSKKFNQEVLRILLALVLMLAAWKLLFTSA